LRSPPRYSLFPPPSFFTGLAVRVLAIIDPYYCLPLYFFLSFSPRGRFPLYRSTWRFFFFFTQDYVPFFGSSLSPPLESPTNRTELYFPPLPLMFRFLLKPLGLISQTPTPNLPSTRFPKRPGRWIASGPVRLRFFFLVPLRLLEVILRFYSQRFPLNVSEV